VSALALEQPAGTESGVLYIVDDDPSVRRALERLAQSAGFLARGYASGREFLSAERVDGPACAVLDLRLPDMHWLEVQRRLARTDPDLPVIVVTGYGDELTRREALAAGATAFLGKPFDDEALLGAIRQAMAGPAPEPGPRRP
jgi:FixJ family two-component response regulator